MSFLASSPRACFYRSHREPSTREADLCFQEAPERHRGPDGALSLLLRWMKRRAAPHGASPRAGQPVPGRRGQQEERREAEPRTAAPPETACGSNPTQRPWPSWHLLVWPLILASPHLLFSLLHRSPTEVAKIQVHGACLHSLSSLGRCATGSGC